jgi:hypothetical protein
MLLLVQNGPFLPQGMWNLVLFALSSLFLPRLILLQLFLPFSATLSFPPPQSYLSRVSFLLYFLNVARPPSLLC